VVQQGLPEDYQTASWSRNAARPARRPRRRIAEVQEAAKQQLIAAGMTVVEDVDMEAFRAAGLKAFEVLGLGEAAAQIRNELTN
jgi:TRAP-type transport system periplasmic protein